LIEGGSFMSELNQPITFRHGAKVANRFVQAPMLTNSGENGFATQDTIDYYNARSKTGGMIVTEYMYVDENGGPALTWRTGREQLAVYDDKFLPQLKKVAAAIKHSGNKAIMQICHVGREANFRAMNGKPVYAPSDIDFPFLPYKVHAFSETQIEKLIKEFGDATKRAIDAGFDGVEIHGANHYLLQQFFSEYSNRRTDNWGGSLEKRMNFPLAVAKEVTETVKKYAPDDFIVGYRISPEEIHGQNIGYTWHDSTKLVDKLTKDYDLDYIHLSMLQYDAKPGDALLMDQAGDTDSKYRDSDKPFATLFKSFLNGAKEIIVGSINSEEAAQKASQLADMVAVGRENLIDPLFADKILNGKADEIITEISPEQVEKTHWTPGLIDVFSSENTVMPLPGSESLRPLHKGFGSWSEMKYPDNPEMK